MATTLILVFLLGAVFGGFLTILRFRAVLRDYREQIAQELLAKTEQELLQRHSSWVFAPTKPTKGPDQTN